MYTINGKEWTITESPGTRQFLVNFFFIFHFHAVFCEKSKAGTYTLEVDTPMWKSWIRHCITGQIKILLNSVTVSRKAQYKDVCRKTTEIGFENQGIRHQKSKTRVSVPPEWTDVLQNFKRKKLLQPSRHDHIFLVLYST